MNYEDFKLELVKKVKEYYGEDADIKITTISGNNNTFKKALHITFRGKDSTICPSIYLNSLFKEYLESEHDFGYFVDVVIQMRKDYEPDKNLKENVEKIKNYEAVKENIYPVLVSQEFNDQYLIHYVNSSFLDLAVIYEIRINCDENESASCKVTYSMLNLYGVSKEELHQQALMNMRNDGYKMESIYQKLHGLLEQEQLEEKENIDLKSGELYVISNRGNRYGAACLLDGELLTKMLGTDTPAIVIPSSVHEGIVIPFENNMSVESINEMIQEINEKEVSASERLSNHCYFWDGKEIRFAA